MSLNIYISEIEVRDWLTRKYKDMPDHIKTKTSDHCPDGYFIINRAQPMDLYDCASTPSNH
jgi:hypothetical protein